MLPGLPPGVRTTGTDDNDISLASLSATYRTVFPHVNSLRVILLLCSQRDSLRPFNVPLHSYRRRKAKGQFGFDR